MNKQLGGTLIGFVVGLLVGLGLALAVAVYVTKVPVPFVDRGISRKPTQDAVEAERNRNWNPNAGITGNKSSAPPKAEAPAEGAIQSAGKPTPAEPAKTEGNKPEAPKADATKASPSADPLGDLARSRAQGASATTTAAAPVAVPAGDDPFNYFVQAGAFRTQTDAETQRAKLAMMGLDAKVTEREQGGQTVYRVRTGPHKTKTEAEGTQAKLSGAGVDAALVRVQR
jgi:cell division protein FtsN